MRGESLEPPRTALLVFDMLNGHVKLPDGSTSPSYQPIVANLLRLLAAARAAGIMVVYAAANHRADGGTSAALVTDTDNRLQPWTRDRQPSRTPVVAGGTRAAQVIDELAPRPEDYIVPKYRWSAFHQTYLDLALRTRGIDTLMVTGGSTDIRVASTAFAAKDLDYNLVIVRDACTATERENHDVFMQRVFPRMARVRTTEQTLSMLPRSS